MPFLPRFLTHLDGIFAADRPVYVEYKGNFIHKLLLFFSVILITLIILELLLQYYPQLFGSNVEFILTLPSSDTEWVFYKDSTLPEPYRRIEFLKPNFRIVRRVPGHWLHKTDSFGFRNNDDKWSTDIVLLGDSFIYGSGVNLEETVSYNLEQLTGMSIVNLAREGDSAFQQYYLLGQYGVRLKPKYVVYFFYENDLHDLKEYLSPEEMIDFINMPLGEIEFGGLPSYHIDVTKAYFLPFLTKPKVIRLIDFVIEQWSINSNSGELLPQYFEDLDTFDPNSLVWQYTKKAILQMQVLSQNNGAKFIMVPITPRFPQLSTILKSFAEENDIPFIDTAMVIRNEFTELFLEGDVHLSKKGHLTLAKLVAKYLTNASSVF